MIYVTQRAILANESAPIKKMFINIVILFFLRLHHRKLLQQTLINVGSSAAVAVMRDQVMADKVRTDTMQRWFSSLPLITK